MKTTNQIGLFALLLMFTLACAEKVNLKAEIQRLETLLAEEPNNETLQTLADLYADAAEKSTDPDEKIRYTWKQGEAARGLNQYDKAARILSSIYEKHPDSEFGSKALFLHAFMLDEDQEDFEQAGQLYQQFLLRYPDSDFHDDAQFLIKNLGKTDEEILETLRKGE